MVAVKIPKKQQETHKHAMACYIKMNHSCVISLKRRRDVFCHAVTPAWNAGMQFTAGRERARERERSTKQAVMHVSSPVRNKLLANMHSAVTVCVCWALLCLIGLTSAHISSCSHVCHWFCIYIIFDITIKGLNVSAKSV